jgi:hypothetical protein
MAFWQELTSVLRSGDGRISFSKCVLVTLLAGWLGGRELAATLALVIVGASHGPKMVREMIRKKVTSTSNPYGFGGYVGQQNEEGE